MPVKEAKEVKFYVQDFATGEMQEITSIPDITAEFKQQDNFCPEESFSFEPELLGGTVEFEIAHLSRAQMLALFGLPSHFGITNNWLRMHHYPMVRRKRRRRK
jgi:hypothetical protein